MNFEKYSKKLSEQLNDAYNVAKRARSKGFEPVDEPEIPIAKDLAGRVEKLIGPKGVAGAIRELNEKHSKETVAFKVAERIINGEFSEGSRGDLIQQAVQTSLGVLTEGVAVAAPTEGVSDVQVVNNHLKISFAGPIRAAGGTGAALSVLIGDYVRKKLGIGAFEAPPELTERFVEEVKIYDEITSLQYLPSDQEIKTAISNIPVEIAGEPTEKKAVNAHKNAPGVDTDRVRGGAMLVIAEGILQKVSKLLKHVNDLGIDGWEWLDELKDSSGDEDSDEGGTSEKDPKYLREIIAGRPVLGYPGEKGAFRLRYGRARNTGLAAGGISPATMRILDDHLALGTQIKLEKPGKATITNPVDAIEGPLVKLENGNVVRVSNEDQARGLVGEVEKILSLGDILLGYGEFVENNHSLLPAGYCEEWWAEEVKEAAEDHTYLAPFVEPPFRAPSAKRAVDISVKHGVPLHPKYTPPYHDLSPEEILDLVSWLAEAEIEVHESAVRRAELPFNLEKKSLLEKLEVPHTVEEKKIVVEEHAHPLLATLCEVDGGTLKFVPPLEVPSSSTDLVNQLAPFEVRKKAPTRIGARMGRPEKSKPRKMRPPVRVLYPVGNYGGATRDIGKAAERLPSVVGEIDHRKKKKLESADIHTVGDLARADASDLYDRLGGNGLVNGTSQEKIQKWIDEANKKRKIPLDVRLFSCPVCGEKSTSRVCPKCGNRDLTPAIDEKGVDVEERFKSSMDRLDLNEEPADSVKGVKGLMNEGEFCEPLEKGILRAKHRLSIYRDGTIRSDLTEAPLTHFKPEEVGVSAERLRELGYETDIYGDPLKKPGQVVEMKPQDLLLPVSITDYFVRAAQYVDDLLERLYGLTPFYKVENKNDLVGELMIALAPHISSGTIGRVIGFTEANIGYAHPYIHAGVRRNADGDEYSVMLLLQSLLDFSKKYLPAGHGGRMDAPLVATHPLNPAEIDDEAHNIDVAKCYTKEFYEATLAGKDPDGLSETVEDRLGSEDQYRNLHFTEAHNSSDISAGPRQCSYKSLGTMEEKTGSQLSIAERLVSVDEDDVAERLLNSHFIPDVKGNIRAFTGQRFRCTNCGTKYRRLPLSGKCRNCGNELIFTVHRGSVEKYVDIAGKIAEEYNVSDYIVQWVELLRREIGSLFDNDGEWSDQAAGNQKSLADYL